MAPVPQIALPIASHVTSLWYRIGCACCITALWLAAPLRVAAGDRDEVLKSFVLPDGWLVEQVAGAPLVEHPLMAGFDDRGRLYVAEAAGVNLKRAELEAQTPNSIRRLQDVDGDGRFDKHTVFADKLTFPQGALWHRGAVYAASSGAIWKFVDADDDGVAELREPIVKGFGYTGNAADVHGPFLAPSGRLVWCEGRHGHEIFDRGGKLVSKGQAARIFSSRLDGSDVQVHCGGGMDNPVEVDFTPEGEMLGDVNLFYRQRGDCFVHWQHGGVYPREDQPDCLAEFRRTGPLLGEVADLGHVAVSGLCRTRSVERKGTAEDPLEWFVTEFNSHKVVRLTTRRHGATFEADVQDFLHSTHDDFHPTDVLEDADGSLLAIDTGGWFLNGCPTSQVAKPEALGGIYRLRRRDAKPLDDPRGLTINLPSNDVAGWAKHLDDPRFAVRERAIEMIAACGPKAAWAALEGRLDAASDSEAVTQRNAVVALIRSRDFEPRNEQAATASLETAWHIKAMGHPSASVRLATVMGLDPRFHASDEKYGKALESLLKDDAAEIQREAAVALGRAGRTSAVPALLARMETPLDRSLEHAVIFSLIELDSPETTVAGLASSNSSVQRAALIALDQMKSGTLEKEEVAPLLASRDAALAETALEVVARRPAWSGELETLVVQAFARPHHAEADRNLVRGAVVALANRPVVENLLAETVGGREPTFEQRLLALDAMSRMRPTKVPLSWPPALAKALAVQDDAAGDSLARETIAVAATLGIESIDAELIALSRDGNAAEDLRAAALIVAASHHRELAANDFELLAARLHPDQAPPDRLAAARGLGLAKLTSEQRRLMASLIETAGPLEVGNLLAAFEGDVSFDRSTAEALARALQGSPGLGSLSATRIENLSLRVPEESQPMFAALVAKLDRGQAEARERLDQLAKDIAGGDVERGRAVFTGKRAACSSCHRATNQGGLVGPDLSTIGQRRSERDLLEAVLYPSLSLARGFESFSIETHDGRSRVGVVVRETPQTLTLRLIDQSDVELARSDIADMSPSPLSVMPAGLEKTMNPTELRDLIAYLKSLK